jgi:hypothetical protein
VSNILAAFSRQVAGAGVNPLGRGQAGPAPSISPSNAAQPHEDPEEQRRAQDLEASCTARRFAGMETRNNAQR